MQQSGYKEQRTMTRTCRCRTNGRSVYRCGWHSAVWLPIVVTILLFNENAATSVTPSSMDYVMNGNTTYCWDVGASIDANNVKSSVNMVSAVRDECPLKLSIALSTQKVCVNELVNISWNAMTRVLSDGVFETNSFAVTQLYTGLDIISQKPYEIVASRLQACPYGFECHPVLSGSQKTKSTTSIPRNFTNGLAEFYSSELLFNSPGDYTLLAHLILPGNGPMKRYDYAVFVKVQVFSCSGPTTAMRATTATSYSASTQNSESSGFPVEVIYVLIIAGIVVVALAIIGYVMLRSKGDRNPEASASKRNSKKGHGMFGFSETGRQTSVAAAVVSDGEAEEFAMLSMDEATIRRNRGSAYLSALNRKRSDAGLPIRKVSPIQFAGPVERLARKGILADNDSIITGDITPQSVSIETPTTGRGNYTSLDHTPKILPPTHSCFDQISAPPGQIMFNDIMEDEVISSGSQSGIVIATVHHSSLSDTAVSDVTDLNLTAVSERIKQHCAIADQEAIIQIKQDVLTADDLRESETKGPMELSDLLASRVKSK